MNRILLIGLMLFSLSCKKDDLTASTGKADSIVTGDLYGQVSLNNIDGTHPSDYSGVTVTAEGTTIFSTTTAGGQFVLADLSAGIHTLVFSKPGYGVMKIPGYQFLGGGETRLAGIDALYQLPQFHISGLAATVQTNGRIDLSGNCVGTFPSAPPTILGFVDTLATVSADPNHYIYVFVASSNINPSNFSGSFLLSQQTASGLKTGQKVYIVVHAESYMGSYTDIVSGHYVFYNINPISSNTVSVVIP